MRSWTISDNTTQGELLARVAAGDILALRAVVTRYSGLVFTIAARILGNADEADDVVQDVFIGLPERLDRYVNQGRFEPWLKRLAARVALMQLRRERRRAQLLEASGHLSDVRTVAPDVARRLDLERAIEGLPRDLRVVFVLKEVVGYTHREIADLLGIRRGTSEVRLFRAIRVLRGTLGDDR